jgi:hypothetical protein
MENGYCRRKSIENANSFTESINEVCAFTRTRAWRASCDAPDVSIGDALRRDKPRDKCREKPLSIDVASGVFLQHQGLRG